MPEPAAWRYQKITKPMFDLPLEERILTGRILTMAGQVIEDGFVQIAGGKIMALGARTDMPKGAVTETGGTIMPGLINSHAHLNWDGIHDLARQSMDDPKPISAFKAAGNMLKSLRAGITMVRDLGFHDMNLYSKQAVEQGIFPGPRLVGEIRALQPDLYTKAGDYTPETLDRSEFVSRRQRITISA